MATTSEKQMTKSNFGISGTYLSFKYSAVRDKDPNYVIFKIEPRVRFSSTVGMNAAVVFCNTSDITSSTSNGSFTHSCACNKTYKNAYKMYYGATGTGTASAAAAYPANNDAWVYGDWSNIKVKVDTSKTKVTLYFHFSNSWGYGNYQEKGTLIWNNAYGNDSTSVPGKSYRIGFDFTVPVGYASNSEPGAPSLSLDKPHLYTNTDSGWDHVVLTWLAPKLGTNNSVSKYRIKISFWGKLDGKTEGWYEKTYPTTTTTNSITIYRSVLNTLAGCNCNAYVMNKSTKWWSFFMAQIEAIDKYNNSTWSDWGEWNCYWNERPSAPTMLGIRDMVDSKPTYGNSSSGVLVPADRFHYTLISAFGAKDRWLPELPGTYADAGKEPSYSCRFVVNDSPNTVAESDFDNRANVDASIDYLAEDWLENYIGGVDQLPPLGVGPRYIHVRAWDTQLYSANEKTIPLLIGEKMTLGTNDSFSAEADGVHPGNLFHYNLMSLKSIEIPKTFLDGIEFNAGTKESIQLQASATDSTGGVVNTPHNIAKTVSRTVNTSVFYSYNDNLIEQTISKLNIDMTPNRTDYAYLRLMAKITPESETRLEKTFYCNARFAVPPVTLSEVGLKAISGKTLYYKYGQVSPFVPDGFDVVFNIAGVFSTQSSYYPLLCDIQYAPLGTSDSPTDDTVIWQSYLGGYEPVFGDGDNRYTINRSRIKASLRSSALKFRLALKDVNGHYYYETLYWPGANTPIENTSKIQYAKVSFTPSPSTIAFKSATENDDYKRIIAKKGEEKNQISISYAINEDATSITPFYVRPMAVWGEQNTRFWPDLADESSVAWQLCLPGSTNEDLAPKITDFSLSFTDAIHRGNVIAFAPNELRFKIENETIASWNYTIPETSHPSGSYPVNQENKPLTIFVEVREPLNTECGWRQIDENNLSTENSIVIGSVRIGVFLIDSRYEVDYQNLQLRGSQLERAGKGVTV